MNLRRIKITSILFLLFECSSWSLLPFLGWFWRAIASILLLDDHDHWWHKIHLFFQRHRSLCTLVRNLQQKNRWHEPTYAFRSLSILDVRTWSQKDSLMPLIFYVKKCRQLNDRKFLIVWSSTWYCFWQQQCCPRNSFYTHTHPRKGDSVLYGRDELCTA